MNIVIKSCVRRKHVHGVQLQIYNLCEYERDYYKKKFKFYIDIRMAAKYNDTFKREFVTKENTMVWLIALINYNW